MNINMGNYDEIDYCNRWKRKKKLKKPAEIFGGGGREICIEKALMAGLNIMILLY